jgi:hypothetical protein
VVDVPAGRSLRIPRRKKKKNTKEREKERKTARIGWVFKGAMED